MPSRIVNRQEDVRWIPCVRIHERTCKWRQFFAVPQPALVVSASSARHRTSRRFWPAASCVPSFLHMGSRQEPMKQATGNVARASRMRSGRPCTLRLSTKSGDQAIYLEGRFDMRYSNSQAILMKKRINRVHPKKCFADRSIFLICHLNKYLDVIDYPYEGKRYIQMY